MIAAGREEVRVWYDSIFSVWLSREPDWYSTMLSPSSMLSSPQCVFTHCLVSSTLALVTSHWSYCSIPTMETAFQRTCYSPVSVKSAFGHNFFCSHSSNLVFISFCLAVWSCFVQKNIKQNSLKDFLRQPNVPQRDYRASVSVQYPTVSCQPQWL